MLNRRLSLQRKSINKNKVLKSKEKSLYNYDTSYCQQKIGGIEPTQNALIHSVSKIQVL